MLRFAVRARLAIANSGTGIAAIGDPTPRDVISRFGLAWNPMPANPRTAVLRHALNLGYDAHEWLAIRIAFDVADLAGNQACDKFVHGVHIPRHRGKYDGAAGTGPCDVFTMNTPAAMSSRKAKTRRQPTRFMRGYLQK